MNKESGMQARYYDCKLNHVKLIMSTLHEIKFIIDRVCLVIRSLFKKTRDSNASFGSAKNTIIENDSFSLV